MLVVLLNNDIRGKNRGYNEGEGSQCFLLLYFLEKEAITMLESNFQAKLIKEIEKKLEGCIILLTDPNHTQGLPDLFVVYEDRWAALECKKSKNSKRQPNQEYYVDKCNDMSYASFIDPTTKKEVLDELQQSLTSGRSTRISKCK